MLNKVTRQESITRARLTEAILLSRKIFLASEVLGVDDVWRTLDNGQQKPRQQWRHTVTWHWTSCSRWCRHFRLPICGQ